MFIIQYTKRINFRAVYAPCTFQRGWMFVVALITDAKVKNGQGKEQVHTHTHAY